MKVHIKLWGTFEATIERPAVDEARGFHIGSRAKVCPSCLQIWATLTVEGDAVYGIDSQFCSQCRREYINGVPGSLLDDRQSWTVDWDMIKYLPEHLLKREFELHVRTFLKEDSHEQPRAYPVGTIGLIGSTAVYGTELTPGS